MHTGIVVTGTELLTGQITDLNGLWLAKQLRQKGADVTQISVVGDYLKEIVSQLNFFTNNGARLIVTSGGLGPTEDDLTIDAVAQFCQLPLQEDSSVYNKITAKLHSKLSFYKGKDRKSFEAGIRKQARVPKGAIILDPVGTAPGIVITHQVKGENQLIIVLPGPPNEFQKMWNQALQSPPIKELFSKLQSRELGMIRLFGIPESQLMESLPLAQKQIKDVDRLEITTCMRDGEIEITTQYLPQFQSAYNEFVELVAEHHANAVFSTTLETVDQQVVQLLNGQTIAVAESCTGGLMAARLTDLPGASAYFVGGVTAYSNTAKTRIVHVPAELIQKHGAVSIEVAHALAQGAVELFGTQVGIGITGIAGPGGGTPDKPVGRVCISISNKNSAELTRQVDFTGNRQQVRQRTTTLVMHMLKDILS